MYFTFQTPTCYMSQNDEYSMTEQNKCKVHLGPAHYSLYIAHYSKLVLDYYPWKTVSFTLYAKWQFFKANNAILVSDQGLIKQSLLYTLV